MSISILFLIFFLITYSYCDVMTLPLKKKDMINSQQDQNLRFLAQSTNSKDLNLKGQSGHAIYTVEISLGKQGDTFNIQVDTGSDTFWVTSDQCEQCKIHYKNSYTCDQTDSCSINPTKEKSISYGDGTTISGQYASVQMKVGEFVIEYQPFLYVTKAEKVISGGEDGIIGLGLRDELGLNQKNWIQQLFDQKKITNQSFSLYYGFGDDSALTIGGINKDFIKDSKPIQYHALSDNDGWHLKTSKVTFGDVSYQVGDQMVTLVDSGTSAIRVNPELYKQIQNLLITKFQAELHQDGPILIHCSKADKLPDLVFNFPDESNKDVPYALPASFYLVMLDKELDACQVFINQGPQDDNRLIVGAAFLRKYLSVYEYSPNKIGLVESIAVPPNFTSKDDSNKFPVYGIVILVIGLVLVVSLISYFVVKYLQKRKNNANEKLNSLVANADV